MFEARPIEANSKEIFYADLNTQLRGLLDGERDAIANCANFASLVYLMLTDLNWAGFYYMRGNDLLLGPFQGKPACVRIPVNPTPKGVCGTAASSATTQLVADVHAFPGHIACDAASRSEIVIPLQISGKVVGVMDIDSPKLARFDEADRAGLEQLCKTLLAMTDFSSVN